jgi:D-alanyl-D-alanine carboxypeptidase
MRNTVLFLLIFGGVVNCGAQTINAFKLDSLMKGLSDHDLAYGSLAIVKNGKQVYSKTIGISHEKDSLNVKASSKTRYRIGTVTQMVTATMIYQLVEQGRIKTDDLLVDYFPDIPNSNLITIAHLLQHRSGLFDYLQHKSIETTLEKPMTREKFFSVMNMELPIYTPGLTQQFNSSNYVLLGYIIEDLTKMKLNDAFKTMIADTAGMKNSYFGGKLNNAKSEAWSFIKEDRWYRAAEIDLSVMGAAGGLVSTASDMSKFISGLYSGKFISMAILDTMTGPSDQFSSGILSFEFSGTKAYGLIGNIDGFMSAVLYFPDSSLAISYLSNGTDFLFEEVIGGIMKIALGKQYEIPGFKPFPVSQQKLTEYVGKYSLPGSPLKVDVYISQLSLHARVEGQDPVMMMPTAPDKFTFPKGGFALEFDLKVKQMTLTQGAGVYLFIRDEE